MPSVCIQYTTEYRSKERVKAFCEETKNGAARKLRRRDSLPLHLPEEKKYCCKQKEQRIACDPCKVRKSIRKIACKSGALHIDRVHKGKEISNIFEDTAY